MILTDGARFINRCPFTGGARGKFDAVYAIGISSTEGAQFVETGMLVAEGYPHGKRRAFSDQYAQSVVVQCAASVRRIRQSKPRPGINTLLGNACGFVAANGKSRTCSTAVPIARIGRLQSAGSRDNPEIAEEFHFAVNTKDARVVVFDHPTMCARATNLQLIESDFDDRSGRSRCRTRR